MSVAERPGRGVAVDTLVTHDEGRWVVDIVVMFADGIVAHRVASYATRRRAEQAADAMRRAADRDTGGEP